jgi:hypothetical protein
MDLEVIAVAAVGAGQAIGMEQSDEEFVAGRLVHQVADREVHDRLFAGAERLISPHFNRSARSRKVASHPFPDMSRHAAQNAAPGTP